MTITFNDTPVQITHPVFSTYASPAETLDCDIPLDFATTEYRKAEITITWSPSASTNTMNLYFQLKDSAGVAYWPRYARNVYMYYNTNNWYTNYNHSPVPSEPCAQLVQSMAVQNDTDTGSMSMVTFENTNPDAEATTVRRSVYKFSSIYPTQWNDATAESSWFGQIEAGANPLNALRIYTTGTGDYFNLHASVRYFAWQFFFYNK